MRLKIYPSCVGSTWGKIRLCFTVFLLYWLWNTNRIKMQAKLCLFHDHIGFLSIFKWHVMSRTGQFGTGSFHELSSRAYGRHNVTLQESNDDTWCPILLLYMVNVVFKGRITRNAKHWEFWHQYRDICTRWGNYFNSIHLQFFHSIHSHLNCVTWTD